MSQHTEDGMNDASRRVRWPWLIAVLLCTGAAHAQQPWLTFRGSASCSPAAHELAPQILAAVFGPRNPSLAVEITIVDGAYARADVRVVRGSALIGSKTIAARTCHEALDAVIAVAALALSS